jgi:REP element-mobilizing transposase RayT
VVRGRRRPLIARERRRVEAIGRGLSGRSGRRAHRLRPPFTFPLSSLTPFAPTRRPHFTMSHAPRLDEPGAVHHVWSRGVARCDIYLDDFDRARFLAIVAHVLKEAHGRCLAWALMSNHYHLLLETGRDPLPRVMQRINQRHAESFNRRHDRVGHLFQDRFGSDRVGDDRHLATLIAYIHLNPVRARIVADVEALAAHPWAGHAALVGRTPRRFHDVDRALAAFGDGRRAARRGVIATMTAVHERWLRGGEVATPRIDIPTSAQARDRAYGVRGVRGRRRFVERVTDELQSRSIRHARFRRAGWSADAVAVHVARRLGARIDDVREGRRTAAETRARAVAAYLAWHCVGATQAEIGRAVGVGFSAISRAIGRGRRQFESIGEEVGGFFK